MRTEITLPALYYSLGNDPIVSALAIPERRKRSSGEVRQRGQVRLGL